MNGQYLITERISLISLANCLISPDSSDNLEVNVAERANKKKTHVFYLIIDTVKNKRHKKEIEFSGHVKTTGASFTAVAYNDDASGSFGMFFAKQTK